MPRITGPDIAAWTSTRDDKRLAIFEHFPKQLAGIDVAHDRTRRHRQYDSVAGGS